VSGDAGDSADRLGNSERIDDGRQLVRTDVPLVLVLTSAGIDLADSELRSLLKEMPSSKRILSLEPGAGSTRELPRDELDRQRLVMPTLPLLRHAEVFEPLSDVLQEFGEARQIAVTSRCTAVAGTVFARLFDAMSMIGALMGTASRVDGAVSMPQRLSVPEELRSLRGDLSAHLRYEDGRSAVVSLSDRAGPWFRGMTITGDGGCIRVTDWGFDWYDADGELRDHHRVKPEAHELQVSGGELFDPDTAPRPGAVAIGRAVKRWRDPHLPRPEAFDVGPAIAMCEAVGLSARTGQPESPEVLLNMM
ncbi:MAG: hypothetical protein AAGB34_09900, partial [Planctomycetota bacterium]